MHFSQWFWFDEFWKTNAEQLFIETRINPTYVMKMRIRFRNFIDTFFCFVITMMEVVINRTAIHLENRQTSAHECRSLIHSLFFNQYYRNCVLLKSMLSQVLAFNVCFDSIQWDKCMFFVDLQDENIIIWYFDNFTKAFEKKRHLSLHLEVNASHFDVFTLISLIKRPVEWFFSEVLLHGFSMSFPFASNSSNNQMQNYATTNVLYR